MPLDQQDEQNGPCRTGEYQNHLHWRRRSASRAVDQHPRRRNRQSHDQNTTCERLNVAERVALDSDQVRESMAMLTEVIVKPTGIPPGPGKKGKDRNPKHCEPQRELNPAVRATFNSMNLHTKAVMRKGFHVPFLAPLPL